MFGEEPEWIAEMKQEAGDLGMIKLKKPQGSKTYSLDRFDGKIWNRIKLVSTYYMQRNKHKYPIHTEYVAPVVKEKPIPLGTPNYSDAPAVGSLSGKRAPPPVAPPVVTEEVATRRVVTETATPMTRESVDKPVELPQPTAYDKLQDENMNEMTEGVRDAFNMIREGVERKHNTYDFLHQRAELIREKEEVPEKYVGLIKSIRVAIRNKRPQDEIETLMKELPKDEAELIVMKHVPPMEIARYSQHLRDERAKARAEKPKNVKLGTATMEAVETEQSVIDNDMFWPAVLGIIGGILYIKLR